MKQFIVTFDTKNDDGVLLTYIQTVTADDFDMNGSTVVFYGNDRKTKIRGFSHVWEVSLVEPDYLA